MNNKFDYKVIVAHPFQQHSFHTAAAFKKTGNLFKYITTVYQKRNSITAFLSRFLKGDNLIRAKGRINCELNESDVLLVCELLSLVLLFLQRYDKNKYLYDIVYEILLKKFGTKAAKYAHYYNVDVIILYDTVSYHSLRTLDRCQSNIVKVLDMSAPYFPYMDKIFKKDISFNINTSTVLKSELNSLIYKNTLRQSIQEVKHSDFYLVASRFSQISLTTYGVYTENISMCPYGINKNIVKNNQVVPENSHRSSKIRCVYVGRVNQQKGFHYLIKAISDLKEDNFIFRIIGAYNDKYEMVNDLPGSCKLIGHIPKNGVYNIYENTDVMIFPSLADGFGLVVLEALSFGIPVICSRNAGASDLIVDGFNGFLVDAGDEVAIKNKLNWIDSNRDKFVLMRNNASISVGKYNWNNYNQNLTTSVDRIVRAKSETLKNIEVA